MDHTTHHVLLIEDNPADAALFVHAMRENAEIKFDITHIESIESLQSLKKDTLFDVAMLDMNLPGISGIGAIQYLKNHDASLPVIVLTGDDDEEAALKAVRNGVQDYLVKGESSGEIIRRAIRYSIERKRYQDQITHLTLFDQLTGLMREEHFKELVQRAIGKAEQNEQQFAIFLADLDNFKHVNDAYGKDVGDKLLVKIGETLRTVFEDKFPVCRLGEDGFLILVEEITETSICADIAEHIMGLFHQPITLEEDFEILTSVSIGIATYPSCGEDAETLIKHSESALRKVKEGGRKHYRLFTESLDRDMRERVTLTNDLYRAIQEGEFDLYYQPQISLRTGEIIGGEALIRWEHPQKGFISPNVFIPLAENSGLIHDINHWVLQRVCADMSYMPYMDISMNLSAQELSHPKLIDDIKEALDFTYTSPDRLVIELTETAVMENVDQAMDVMQQLKKLGLKIHIDDFGTGYSSLSHLRHLPADCLKIDQSFVRNMPDNEEDKKIVKVIIDLAHDLNLTVIAEGVETMQQANHLRLLGCETAQGYLYSQPMPLTEFLQWKKQVNRF